jgi:hypothetical protein
VVWIIGPVNEYEVQRAVVLFRRHRFNNKKTMSLHFISRRVTTKKVIKKER